MSETSEQRAKDISAAVAIVRDINDDYSGAFELEELAKNLKSVGCPYSNRVPTILRKAGKIEKTSAGYKFISRDPIHYKIIKIHLDPIVEGILSGQKKECGTPTDIVESNRYDSQPSEVSMTIEEMIAELKAAGYKVYAPITDYVEI